MSVRYVHKNTIYDFKFFTNMHQQGEQLKLHSTSCCYGKMPADILEPLLQWLNNLQWFDNPGNLILIAILFRAVSKPFKETVDRIYRHRAAAVAPTKNTATEARRQKRRRTARAATQTQALRLTPDALAAALEDVPAEDWSRTWPSCRTIMLRRTSKRVNKAVDKMRLPAVVRLSRSFYICMGDMSTDHPGCG
jgi:hypothetical protein